MLRPFWGLKLKPVWFQKKATNQKNQRYQRKTVLVLWLRCKIAVGKSGGRGNVWVKSRGGLYVCRVTYKITLVL